MYIHINWAMKNKPLVSENAESAFNHWRRVRTLGGSNEPHKLGGWVFAGTG